MNPSDTASIQVALTEDSEVYVRVQGKGISDRSPRFKSLILGYLDQGMRKINVVLSDCPLMDSTFIGVLAGIGSTMLSNGESAAGPARLRLLNSNDRVRRSIENLGVDEFFEYVDAEEPDLDYTEFVGGTDCYGKQAVGKTALQAHEDLCRFQPGNQRAFKDVIEFIRLDLERDDQDDT